ncbi:unnamed protein product [Rodentolepis nana]|uniref:Secreted protein n=1 Tax=Rodentolepis nana TaxID=102285 RepID=A0A0R3TFW6_RODNA|nr:unnamed protein product [Rodentolepis nana]
MDTLTLEVDQAQEVISLIPDVIVTVVQLRLLQIPYLLVVSVRVPFHQIFSGRVRTVDDLQRQYLSVLLDHLVAVSLQLS